MARSSSQERLIASNRRARHDYELLETLECGIALRGTEVKSLRAGRASIGEAYGKVQDGELWLVGATIPEYSHGNAFNHEPTRPRKLLLHRRQLASWVRRSREKGMTLVPLRLYFRGHLVKVEMALARGRKHHDRREATRRREAQRDMERAFARRRR